MTSAKKLELIIELLFFPEAIGQLNTAVQRQEKELAKIRVRMLDIFIFFLPKSANAMRIVSKFCKSQIYLQILLNTHYHVGKNECAAINIQQELKAF